MNNPSLNNPSINQSNLALKLSLYIIPFACGLIYWLAFFPGIMSFDSVYQWDQLATFKITNMHPAINTILMWMLTRIWYSPAIISLFQVIFASLVIGYGLNSILKVSRLPAYIFIALAIIISANPIVGLMDVTLWKDVLYGFLVLLLSIFMFNIVSSDGEWVLKTRNFILLGCTVAGVWLVRFNGYPIAVASLITILIIYKKYYKHLVYSSLIALTIILFVGGPLYTWFKVNKEIYFSYGLAFIHPVVAYVNSQTDLTYLTVYEQQYLNQIYPLNKPWPYSCYDATVFYYKNANLLPVIRDPLTMVKIFTKSTAKDPKIMLNHYLCLSSFVWQPNQPRNVYLETVLLDNYNVDQTPAWMAYKDVVTQHSLLPDVRGFIKHIVEAESRRDIYRILWRPALYMYMFLASLAFFVARTRRMKWIILSVPLITQSVVIMISAPLQALRYQYPIYLISMLFSFPLIILGIQKSEPIQPSNLATPPTEN